MRKRLSAIFIFALFMCILLVVYNKIPNTKSDNDVLVEIALCRPGTYDRTYYFVLKTDKILEASFGERKNDYIKSKNFLKEIYRKDFKELSEQEFSDIVESIDKIVTNLDSLTTDTSDAWNVSLVYKNKVYILHNSESPIGDTVGSLVYKLNKYSPIEVIASF